MFKNTPAVIFVSGVNQIRASAGGHFCKIIGFLAKTGRNKCGRKFFYLYNPPKMIRYTCRPSFITIELLLHQKEYKVSKFGAPEKKIFYPLFLENQKSKTNEYPIIFVVTMDPLDSTSIVKKFQNGYPHSSGRYRIRSVKNRVIGSALEKFQRPIRFDRGSQKENTSPIKLS